jgi:histone acetyltransferase (RNA polymerase elongator complex component)
MLIVCDTGTHVMVALSNHMSESRLAVVRTTFQCQFTPDVITDFSFYARLYITCVNVF